MVVGGGGGGGGWGGGGGGGAGGALKLYVINLREQHPMLLHFTSQETI